MPSIRNGNAIKKSKQAKERSEAKRAAFVEQIKKCDPAHLVFLDECGFSLSLYRLYGWCPSNERCVEDVPFVRGQNRSVLGAFSLSGMQALMHQLGAIKRVDFEAFLRDTLLPVLPKGSILVLDNARTHHGGEVAAIVEAAGYSLLYLPPYAFTHL